MVLRYTSKTIRYFYKIHFVYHFSLHHFHYKPYLAEAVSDPYVWSVPM